MHTPELVSKVFASEEEPRYFTSDTYSNEFTARAGASGSWLMLWTLQLQLQLGAAPSGAAICRPPGHHAESGSALGFLLFQQCRYAVPFFFLPFSLLLFLGAHRIHCIQTCSLVPLTMSILCPIARPLLHGLHNAQARRRS